MEPSYRCESWRPLYPVHHHHHHHHHPMILGPHPHHHKIFHHHHHHHHSICCPLHHLVTCHSHASPNFAPLPLQNNLNLESTTAQNEFHHFGTPELQEQEYEIREEGEEEEEEPVFVLTDEWREFFAKSEAKRKLEKQQAKEKQKKLNSAT